MDISAEAIDKSVALIKQAVTAAAPMMQKAYETTLTVLRIDAAGDIIVAGLFVIVGVILAVLARKFWKKRTGDQIDDVHWIFGCFLSAIFAISCGIVASVNLGSIWLWVKLLDPQLWLAHAAIEKIIR